eukprot:COSAG06_NODE_69_length_26016_cov_6.603272_8_plen_89_part_00
MELSYLHDVSSDRRRVYTWTPIQSMSTCTVRSSSSAMVTTLNGLMYVVGGSGGSSTVSSGERYDLATDTWTPIQSMSTAHAGAVAVAL